MKPEQNPENGRKVASAQDDALRPAYIPFPMGDDAPNEGVTDVSALNPAPSGRHGRLTVDGEGHIVDPDGRRVRFLGTNFTHAEAFPDHARAERLARRLASLGINIVRIHHIDKSETPQGIWKDKPWHDELDPDQLDRLDYLFYQFKKNGIYADLNLHVSHRYWLGEDFSKDGLKNNRERTVLLPQYAKGLDRIEDDFIAQQKIYARMLLGHTNAYTGLRYAEDPVIAIVEINNESSFHGLNPMTLPAYYRERVQAKFNAWLRAKYGGTEALRAAWGSPEPLGKEVFTTLPCCHEDAYIRVEAASPQTVKITLTGSPERADQAQVQWKDLTLEEGEVYTFSFSARSDIPRKIPYGIRHQVADCLSCGLNGEMLAEPEWKTVSATFVAANAEPGLACLDVTLGNTPPGSCEIRDLSLRKGGDIHLRPEESLEAGTVQPVSSTRDFPGRGGSWNRARDWYAFALDTEEAYARTFKQLIREELGCNALLFDSQCAYGGLAGLIRENRFDIIDNHAYWQHPVFPNSCHYSIFIVDGREQCFDPAVWNVNNLSLADHPQKTATLCDLAIWRVAGKPFTVTEYDHPAPNEHVAEMFPMLATFAALQDWDGVFQFDWGQHIGGPNWIHSWFDLQSHPGKLAFLPAAAILFRAAAVAPLPATAQLTLPGGAAAGPFAALHPNLRHLWDKAGLEAQDNIAQRLSVRFDPDAAQPGLVRSEGGGASPLTWTKGCFRLDVPAAKVLAGAITGKTHTFTDAAITLNPSASGFAALTLTAMDLKPVRASATLLLTVAGAVENTDMGWNRSHTSVGTAWGKAPTRCEAIRGDATLHTDAKTATVYALDGKGRRKTIVASTLEQGRLTFRMGPEAETLWYEIAAQ